MAVPTDFKSFIESRMPMVEYQVAIHHQSGVEKGLEMCYQRHNHFSGLVLIQIRPHLKLSSPADRIAPEIQARIEQKL